MPAHIRQYIAPRWSCVSFPDASDPLGELIAAKRLHKRGMNPQKGEVTTNNNPDLRKVLGAISPSIAEQCSILRETF